MAFLSARVNNINVAKVVKEKNKLKKKYSEYIQLNKDVFGNADDLPKFDCFKIHSPMATVKKRDSKKAELDITFSIFDPYFYNDNYNELKNLLRSCLIDINYFNPIIKANTNMMILQDQASHVQIKCCVKEEHMAYSYVSDYLIYEFFIQEWFRKVSKYSHVQPSIGTKPFSNFDSLQVPWLVVHSSNAFQNTRQACHEETFTATFKIGTLFRSTSFMAHFTLQSNCGFLIEVNFYHDTKEVQINFAEKFMMAFKYSNIRHIFVDKTESAIMYFNLINPPAIYSYVEEEKEGAVTYVKKRVSNLFYLASDVIGRSNTISLDFPNPTISGQILSRLFVKTNKHPMSYVVMRSTDVSAPTSIPPVELSSYPCTYLLNAIFRRSFVLQLQNLLREQFESLVQMFDKFSDANPQVLYNVLMEVLRALDEGVVADYRLAILQLFQLFQRQKNDKDNDDRFLTPPRCKKVWRLFITPTRYVFFPAEISFENRVIRKYSGEFALRVSFRDDDYGKLNNIASQCSEDFIRKIVFEPMIRGISVGSRKFEFLGWSNSQLRDHGVYMYARDHMGNTANSIRSWLGNFTEIKSVSKFMARLGQCFSHSEDAVAVSLESSRVETEPDIVGGVNPINGKPYVFSDGVGRISLGLMEEVATVLQFEYVPSAIQFRCAGYKGMLTMDPTLTDRDIVFRESQKKFTCKESQRLEVVSKSGPVPVFLNRQLITILDQKGITAAVFLEIQQEMLQNLTEMLLDDDKSAKYLTAHSALPKIKYDDINSVGISLTNEPFFRNMLLSQHRVAIDGIRKKSRIAINPNLGRNLFGVMDETGKLRYGEVFVQCTATIEGHETNRESIILKGDLLVTKNPCLHFGDVRMLKAVDVKELHHIVDCIVFPQRGPRPHPNEMAGSDLDGDEYTVLWKKELFFQDGNTPAFDFPIPLDKGKFDEVTVADMLQFLYHYIINDQVGVIGNAHLAKADDTHFGLNHPLCETLAQKFCMAVDFAKNGQKVQLGQSEKPRMYPDFMEKGSLANTYCSKRVLGKLYRVCKDYEEKSTTCLSIKKYTEIDPCLVHPLWQKYNESAVKSSLKYKKLLSLLLNTYGVEDEFQACGKAYVSVRSRAERKELMDIEEIVSRSLRQLWKTFEEEFLQEFYSEDMSLETLSEEMLMKASAWYYVTYSNPNTTFLSFPWICWKYLINLRRRHIIVKTTPSFNSFLEKIQENLQSIVKFNYLAPLPEAQMKRCVAFAENHNKLAIESGFKNTIVLNDVELALRILLKWAVLVDIVDVMSVLENDDDKGHKSSVTFFNDIFFNSVEAIQIQRPPMCIELIVAFLQRSASLRFLTKDNNRFPTYSIRKQKFLGKKAIGAYHGLAVSGNLFSIGLMEPGFEYNSVNESEMEPIKIDKGYVKMSLEQWKSHLQTISEATDVHVRELGRYFLISASGSNRSLRFIEKYILNLLKI